MKKLNAGLVTLAALFLLVSCDDDGLTNQDIIVGEWEITRLDGEDVGQEHYDDDGYSYQIKFGFEANGDWEYCWIHYEESNFLYCNEGEWSFQNANQTELELEYQAIGEPDYYGWDLAIETISADRIEGEITIKSGEVPPVWGDEDPHAVVLEKLSDYL